MGSPFSLIKGLGLGAGLMYFLDPRQGERRRAELGDRVADFVHGVQGAVENGVSDLSQKVGLTSESTSAPAPLSGHMPASRAESGGLTSELTAWFDEMTPSKKLALGAAGTVAGLAVVRSSGLMLPALGLLGAALYAKSKQGGPPILLADRVPDARGRNYAI